MAFEPWNCVNGEEVRDKGQVEVKKKEKKKPAERWEEVIWQVRDLAKEVLKERKQVNELKEKLKELYDVDKELKVEFKKTEEFLKKKNLKKSPKKTL
jgi:hypothetical protein